MDTDWKVGGARECCSHGAGCQPDYNWYTQSLLPIMTVLYYIDGCYSTSVFGDVIRLIGADDMLEWRVSSYIDKYVHTMYYTYYNRLMTLRVEVCQHHSYSNFESSALKYITTVLSRVTCPRYSSSSYTSCTISCTMSPRIVWQLSALDCFSKFFSYSYSSQNKYIWWYTAD